MILPSVRSRFSNVAIVLFLSLCRAFRVLYLHLHRIAQPLQLGERESFILDRQAKHLRLEPFPLGGLVNLWDLIVRIEQRLDRAEQFLDLFSRCLYHVTRRRWHLLAVGSR